MEFSEVCGNNKLRGAKRDNKVVWFYPVIEILTEYQDLITGTDWKILELLIIVFLKEYQ